MYIVDENKTVLLLKCCCLFGLREQQDEPGVAAVVSCRTNINKGKYMSSSSKLIFLWRQVFAAATAALLKQRQRGITTGENGTCYCVDVCCEPIIMHNFMYE